MINLCAVLLLFNEILSIFFKFIFEWIVDLIHLMTEDIYLSLRIMLIFESQSLVFILLFHVYAERHHQLRASILLNFKITVFFHLLKSKLSLCTHWNKILADSIQRSFDLSSKNVFDYSSALPLDIPLNTNIEGSLYHLQKFTILQWLNHHLAVSFNNDFFVTNFCNCFLR